LVLIALGYVSHANFEDASAASPDIQNILASAQKHNSANNVTGVLVSDGKRFLQILEGDEASVIGTYLRISNDSRHRMVESLGFISIETRHFPAWKMQFGVIPETKIPVHVGRTNLPSPAKDDQLSKLIQELVAKPTDLV
jgi:Sensors of blue-light using FAD